MNRTGSMNNIFRTSKNKLIGSFSVQTCALHFSLLIGLILRYVVLWQE
jgi:hypothetical protein